MYAFCKTLIIVWHSFLVCGPWLPLVSWLSSRVLSITTDMGVERNIANHVDLLTEMYVGLDPKCAHASVTNSQMWQFPRALKMPGWKHCWDLMVRKGLTSLRFFPDWILKFKAVVSLKEPESPTGPVQELAGPAVRHQEVPPSSRGRLHP